MRIKPLKYAWLLPLFLTASCSKTPSTETQGKDEKAPSTYRVNFETSKGGFVVEVNREWAPMGADRFYSLVKDHFYDNSRFFRVLPTFMVQFGLAANPEENKKWGNLTDDPVTQSNKPGYITYATAGPGTRTTQVFINYADNEQLDKQGFAPFGKVVSGMDVVRQLYKDYGEGAPGGNGPAQDQIQALGNTYLERDFPKLDYIKTARLASGQ